MSPSNTSLPLENTIPLRQNFLNNSLEWLAINKEPDLFIKQLKGIFKKIVTMPIENDSNSVSAEKLYKIATKNKFKTEKSVSFAEALKKIRSSEKKLIVCFGSLYNCGNILNKN